MIWQIILLGVRWLIGCFTPSHDERLGRAEVTVDAQKLTIKEMEVDKKVSDRVDNMSDADIARLSDRLNKRSD